MPAKPRSARFTGSALAARKSRGASPRRRRWRRKAGARRVLSRFSHLTICSVAANIWVVETQSQLFRVALPVPPHGRRLVWSMNGIQARSRQHPPQVNPPRTPRTGSTSGPPWRAFHAPSAPARLETGTRHRRALLPTAETVMMPGVPGQQFGKYPNHLGSRCCSIVRLCQRFVTRTSRFQAQASFKTPSRNCSCPPSLRRIGPRWWWRTPDCPARAPVIS